RRSGVKHVAHQVDLTALPRGSLKVPSNRIHQPAVVVGYHQIDPCQPPLLQPCEKLRPARLRLAVADHQPQDLSVALGIHPYGQYGALGDHAPAFADLELQGIHDHKRVRYRLQRTLVPFPDDGVQGFAQLGHRRLGEACPTQLFGDTTHLPGRYPVDHHLHPCQKERLLTALIPFEQLRRERAVANPRHPQLQRPDSGLHFPSAVAIAVSQALFRTLKGRRLQLLGHLCMEYLVYDTLQQLSHTLVSTKKLVQYLAIYGNLVLGHHLQPPFGFVDLLNHYQKGDGPSYCYAILILECTPSYRTLLGPANVERDGMVEQAVKDGRGDDIIAKDAPPIAVALVAGDDDGPFLVTPRNELKEQVSLEAVQLGVAHLVANQELRFDVDPQLAGKTPLAIALREALDHVLEADEIDAVAQFNGPHAQANREMGFAHARRAQQQHVGGPFHERHRGQVLNRFPVNTGLGVKVELLKGLAEGEMGQPGAGFDVPCVPGCQLLFQQGRQVAEVAHVGPGGFFSTVGSHLGHVSKSQLLKSRGQLRHAQAGHAQSPTLPREKAS